MGTGLIILSESSCTPLGFLTREHHPINISGCVDLKKLFLALIGFRVIWQQLIDKLRASYTGCLHNYKKQPEKLYNMTSLVFKGLQALIILIDHK